MRDAFETTPEWKASVEGRILEQLASDGLIAGTLDAVAQRFGQTPDDLRECLRELVRAKWIAVQTQPGGYLAIRLERRTSNVEHGTRNRRRFRSDSWRL